MALEILNQNLDRFTAQTLVPDSMLLPYDDADFGTWLETYFNSSNYAAAASIVARQASTLLSVIGTNFGSLDEVAVMYNLNKGNNFLVNDSDLIRAYRTNHFAAQLPFIYNHNGQIMGDCHLDTLTYQAILTQLGYETNIIRPPFRTHPYLIVNDSGDKRVVESGGTMFSIRQDSTENFEARFKGLKRSTVSIIINYLRLDNLDWIFDISSYMEQGTKTYLSINDNTSLYSLDDLFAELVKSDLARIFESIKSKDKKRMVERTKQAIDYFRSTFPNLNIQDVLDFFQDWYDNRR